jgi:phosphoglycolate phosphatase-like HAD superfamily hydrolase
MIRQLMRVTGIDDPALVAKVGDTEVDILEGRNAGVGLVVSVTTGAYKRDELLPFHPDHIINSLEDFIPLLISA